MDAYLTTVSFWRSHNITAVADLDKYLDSFRILFAYNSGKIENEDVTYHDTREIFEEGKVTGYTGNPRTLFEQQNQKLCYEVLKNKIVAREPISIALIKEIHHILTEGTYDERRYIVNEERPGEFKRHDYVTGIHEVGSPAENVEEDLSELLSEINEQGKKNPLKAGAYFHACFEYIHPFADGNGRVGRTLLNYWLMINNHPPIVVYDEEKAEYYACLQAYDEDENLDALVAFLKREAEKTWKKTIALSTGEKKERKGFSAL